MASRQVNRDMPKVDRSAAMKETKWANKPLPKKGDVGLGQCAAEILRKFQGLCPVDAYAIARNFRDNMSQAGFNDQCRHLPKELPTQVEDRPNNICENYTPSKK